MKNKVLIITSDQDEFREKLEAYDLPDLEIIAPDDLDRISDYIDDVNIIFGNPFRFQKYLDSATKLVWAQSTFAWVDALCKQWSRKDYLLTNIKDAYGSHMSEYVFAYILMIEKGVLWNLEKQKNKNWQQEWYPTLQGKTMTILGTGSIWKVIAKIAKSFGMETIGYNLSGKQVEYFDEICTDADKQSCFERADYLVSVLPNTKETVHCVNSESLWWMKSSAWFINVGRGLNVHEEELIEALKNDIIAGAILDVFQTEPLPKESPLWNIENVFITPHVSWYVEDNARLVEIFANNYKKFHAGEQLDYLIDFERGF